MNLSVRKTLAAEIREKIFVNATGPTLASGLLWVAYSIARR